MSEIEWINAAREYVSVAAAGICIGAALTIIVPAEITSFAGLEHMDHIMAVKTALVAAAVSIIARKTRIIIRRR